MNWEAAGAIGEILGAIVVAVTVVYLAFQTRSTRDLVQRATTQTISDSYGLFQSTVASDKELADIWNRGTDDLASLDAIERTRFVMLWSMYTTPIRAMWNAGNRDEVNYRSWARMLQRQGAREIYEERKGSLPPELVDHLGKYIDGGA